MRSIISILTMTALVVTATASAARAEQCADIRQQQRDVRLDVARLITDYPGIHIVIGICGSVAQNQSERTGDDDDALGAFAACTLVGCAIAGFDNCGSVAGRWAELIIREEGLKKALESCQ